MKQAIYSIVLLILITSCGPTKSTRTKLVNNVLLERNTLGTSINIKEQPKDEILKKWMFLDLNRDTIPGISINRAYQLLAGRPSKTVIVGVIDSGVDIYHEDLKDVIWVNSGEIANNGIDDDNNGYIDDVHGWNFLGKSNKENLEMTRILKKNNRLSPDYIKAQKAYDKELLEAKEYIPYLKQIKQKINQTDSLLTKELGKDYTLEDVTKFAQKSSTSPDILQLLAPMIMLGKDLSEMKDEINEGLEYYQNAIDYHLNLDFDGRAILGENTNDFSRNIYGNNNVIGPDKKDALHGTHVAGIIAAKRNNNIGMNGVADDVRIMTVRTVPDGDEYDKDVYNAIRYAVDNGAKVINASFGKDFSPYAAKVQKAIQYAASKDVLIICAAGNDSTNIDITPTYPTDFVNGTEISDNFLTVGATAPTYGDLLVAPFSNYGKQNVDVFAPGVQIWSTTPNNSYKYLQGTSMASPSVAGVAALIRSRFPSLKAGQVKKIIMDSGLGYAGEILTLENYQQSPEQQHENGHSHKDGHQHSHNPTLSDISKSGKMVNAYNAIILAAKMVNNE